MRAARGFTLVVVMLVAVVVAVVGSTAVLVGTHDAGTAAARNMRAQALAAAEAGLAHFQQVAHPGSIVAGTYYLGGAGDADADFRWLPRVPGRQGEMLDARYRVRGLGPGPLPGTGLALVEGEVLSGGGVVGRATLGVAVQSMSPGSDAGRQQEDDGSAGGSGDGYGSQAPIRLQGGAFDG